MAVKGCKRIVLLLWAVLAVGGVAAPAAAAAAVMNELKLVAKTLLL
jgi:hypothetical protein